MEPTIQGTTFGRITVDAEEYERDIVIRLTGKVKKRKKKLSKKEGGTSHTVSLAEAKYIFDKGAAAADHRHRPGRTRPTVAGGTGVFPEEGMLRRLIPDAGCCRGLERSTRQDDRDVPRHLLDQRGSPTVVPQGDSTCNFTKATGSW